MQLSCVLCFAQQLRRPAVLVYQIEPSLLPTSDKTAYVILPECIEERKPTELARELRIALNNWDLFFSFFKV